MQQQPPMQPMGAQASAPARVTKRGTSKVVPIVVSAGLAIGTFCGLLFGLGTGEVVADTRDAKKALAEAQKAADKATAEASKPADPAPAAKPADPAPAKPADPATASAAGSGSGSGSAAGSGSGSGSAVAAGSGSGSGSATTASAGSGSGAAAPAVAKGAKLTFVIKPDGVKSPTITVDGKAVTGDTFDLAFDSGQTKKSVKVVVKASGFKDQERTLDVDADMKAEFELTKVGHATGTPVVTNTPAPHTDTPPAKQNPPKQNPPKQNPPKKDPKKPANTLIDI